MTLWTVPFGIGLSLLLSSPAAAQIFTWRDAHGTLVLSDRPQPGNGDVTAAGVPPGAAIRAATSVPATAGKGRFDPAIERQAARHGISADLIRAVIQVESAFDPRAVSSKGAMGLMQLMPATATEYGVQDPFQPEQNIRAGAAYLKRLLDRYDNKVELALAAYNAGPGNVEKYGAVPPFRETRNYVNKVTAATEEAAPAPPNAIYKWMDLVEGQPVMRYSNRPPASGAYEVVGLRR